MKQGMRKKLICHYTKQQAGIAILNSKNLWACDYRNMDDEKELFFLLEHVGYLLKDSIISGFDENLKKVSEHIRFYIFSSTKHKHNSLDAKYGNLCMGRYFGESEWLGIVFNQIAIEKRLKNFSESLEKDGYKPALIMGKVNYYEPDETKKFQNNFLGAAQIIAQQLSNFLGKRRLVKYLAEVPISSKGANAYLKLAELIQELFLDISRGTIINKIEENNIRSLRAFASILFALIITKHIGFHNENEVRFVVSMVFNEINQSIIDANIKENVKPHIEIPFDYPDIDSIIIGPCNEQKKVIDEIIEIGLTNDHSFRVIPSTIPWRFKQA